MDISKDIRKNILSKNKGWLIFRIYSLLGKL